MGGSRHEPTPHAQGDKSRLHNAGEGQSVPSQGFGAADQRTVVVDTKYGFDRPHLADIPDWGRSRVGVDMVDIFRKSEAVPAIVNEALELFPALQTIWMQIGVEHAGAAANAESRGVTVIQNRCPKIEYQRLYGELRMGGFATGVISSKL